MELTGEVLQPLGVSAILAVLVFFLLYWIKQLVTDLQDSYRKNTEATVQQVQIMQGLKDTQEKFIDRFDQFLRNGNNGRGNL